MSSLSLRQSVCEEYSGSLFRKAEDTAATMGLESVFEKFAEKGGYESGMDWLLCHLFPVYEKECRAYYAGNGRKFKELHMGLVQRIDRLMVLCIRTACMKDEAAK